jgi:glycosyltransferase involved in cell wall biosynthesis
MDSFGAASLSNAMAKVTDSRAVKNSMRVLMIGPGEGVGGGIATLVETFLPVLSQRVTLRYLPSVKQRPLKDSGKLSIRNLSIAVSLYVRFLIALIRFRPALIHLHTSQGIAWLKDTFFVIIGKLCHVRVVLHMHGGNFDVIYRQNNRFIQGYTRWVIGLADAVISVSEEWKERFIDLFPQAFIFPLINCIDVQSFREHPSVAQNQIAILLFIGRIGPLKGAFDLIEALNILYKDGCLFQAFLVGPEEREGDFQIGQQLIGKYGLAPVCKQTGAISRATVTELLQKADVFILPSYYEGMPMVILEALSAGLPVIATPVGGIPEVVRENHNGLLVEPGDIGAISKAIETLLANASLRMEMGQRSRKIAEQELDVSAYVEKMMDLYASFA